MILGSNSNLLPLIFTAVAGLPATSISQLPTFPEIIRVTVIQGKTKDFGTSLSLDCPCLTQGSS